MWPRSPHEIGGADLLAHLLEGVEALGRAGLLEPVDLAGLLERAAEADGGRHVEAAMRVDQHVDVGAGRLADQRRQFGGLALVLARHAAVEIAVALLARPRRRRLRPLVGEGIELERGVSGLRRCPGSRATTPSLLVNLRWSGWV